METALIGALEMQILAGEKDVNRYQCSINTKLSFNLLFERDL